MTIEEMKARKDALIEVAIELNHDPVLGREYILAEHWLKREIARYEKKLWDLELAALRKTNASAKWAFPGTSITIEHGRLVNGKIRDYHEDVNGKWGGYEAVVAHVTSDNKDEKELMLLYMLVGDYYSVGMWPDDDPPSQWSVVKMVVYAMLRGVPPARLEEHILKAIGKDND
jgi:hypothetical protein